MNILPETEAECDRVLYFLFIALGIALAGLVNCITN